MAERFETATFAAGCFWCVEAVFSRLRGVETVISGYTGGSVPNPTYREVCGGTTGHAEAVRIDFDPEKISFAELLDVFWRIHDPTTLNRQGADVGTQYRSAIFYADEREQQLAEAFLADLADAGVYADPIVTTLEPLTQFHPAEPYHQNYVCNNPLQGYVRGVALPKVEKVRKKFADRLKDTSPLDR